MSTDRKPIITTDDESDAAIREMQRLRKATPGTEEHRKRMELSEAVSEYEQLRISI